MKIGLRPRGRVKTHPRLRPTEGSCHQAQYFPYPPEAERYPKICSLPLEERPDKQAICSSDGLEHLFWKEKNDLMS